MIKNKLSGIDAETGQGFPLTLPALGLSLSRDEG